MRVIQLQIPARKRKTVRGILEEKGIDYIITDATGEGGNVVVIHFPVPRQAVETVLTEFRDAGIDVDSQYRVNLNAEIARATNLSIKQLLRGTGNYIAHEELRVRAREMTPAAVTYYSMTLLGTVVATCGLLMNSSAVVVGSMVIAPQLGSALTASVGIAIDDRNMIVKGISSQLFGLALGLLGAAVFGAILRWTMIVPPVLDLTTVAQIGSRISPGLLSVTVGLSAGAGAAISLATLDTPSGPLVGIMVSAALIPAAATAGIGIAWRLPHVVIGALVLLVVNVVCINLAGPVVLWLIGYRPAGWGDGPAGSIRSLTQYSSALLTVSLLLMAVVGAGFLVGQQVTFEQRVKSSVNEVLGRDRYEDVELRDVSTEYAGVWFSDTPQRVTLVVSQSTNESYPKLGGVIQREITSSTGYPVTVRTEFVTRNQTVANDSGSTGDADSRSDEATPADPGFGDSPSHDSRPRSVAPPDAAPARMASSVVDVSRA